MKSGRPFVAATFAMTIDGKITTKNFSPVDFTSREDKLHLWQQRALADAVVVGYSTLEHDDVRLALPAELREGRIKSGKTETPLRVIVSNSGKIDNRLKIFQSDVSPILIFSTTRMPEKYQEVLREKCLLYLSRSRTIDLRAMLRTLATKYRVGRVACEGGARLFRSFVELGLIDQLNLTIAPYLFGGRDAPTLTGLSKEFLARSVHFRITGMRVMDKECFLTYRKKVRRG
jgi:2,5-diamino-6-(ribosylamino)-4(3H)-pyrimidinone 5'-phosphate reductase